MGIDADYRDAAAAIASASSIVIGSHVDPDGDAIGSCLGLARALEAPGRTITIVTASGNRCPSTYAFLPGAERFVAASSVSQAPDLFIALDAPVGARLGEAEPLARSAGSLLMIDHHPDAVAEGDRALFDAAAPATGAMVWALLGHLGVRPDEAIATCLYVALMTDTGRFSYSNTTAAALRIAAEMVDAGAEPARLYTLTYENRSAAAQRLIGLTLGRVTLANGGAVAYSWVRADDFASTGALPEESENLIDHVRALAGVQVVFLAKADAATVRCSMRSKDGTDVGAIARALGGGGHAAAAGFTFNGTLDGLLAILLPLLPGGLT